MSEQVSVYDLGDLDAPSSRCRRRPAAGSEAPSSPSIDLPQGLRVRKAPRTPTREPGSPGVAGSLSLFIPGAGQLLVGEREWGLFYLSWTGLAAALLWAIGSRLAGVSHTLELLGCPREAAFWAMVALFLAAANFHVSSVLHAHDLASPSCGRGPHPLPAAIASLLLPGWGQILNGARKRAAFFLSSLWFLAAAGLPFSGWGHSTLRTFGLALPSTLSVWIAPALGTLAAVVWSVAIYDAASCAAQQRSS